MLLELALEDFAVVEALRVRFHAGLNVLTGETGSGKSILVDALALLLGGRASPEMVRGGASRARIRGIFETGSRILPEGIESEDGELILEREILSNGKSRAFAGGRAVTASVLREIGDHLADIHGQHDQQQLFSSAAHRDMLDQFAGHQPQLDQLSKLYGEWRAAHEELAELERSAQEKLRQSDLLQFQNNEIGVVNPQAGEDAHLENERRVLRNVVRLEETAGAAYQALYEDPESVTAQLRAVTKRLEELVRIDESVKEVVAALAPAPIAVDEAAHALRHYLSTLEADPARLEEVETRLATLEKLKRKYGATIDDVVAFGEQVRQQLTALDLSGERQTQLTKRVKELAASYESAAALLSVARKTAAQKLARKVESELAALAMEKTRVEIRVTKAEWSASGSDAVEFLISPNLGEPLKAIEKIASGGELSRVALALKSSTAPGKSHTKDISAPHTLVFDEIDAGVGGSAAEAVGRRLKKLAAANQVLCVTHLAQIASFADHHYCVEKHTVKGRTSATVEEMKGPARTREIGRMLSGENLTPEALRHAEQILKLATS